MGVANRSLNAFETEKEHLLFNCKMTNVCLFKVSSVALGHQFKLSRLYIKTKKANHTKVWQRSSASLQIVINPFKQSHTKKKFSDRLIAKPCPWCWLMLAGPILFWIRKIRTMLTANDRIKVQSGPDLFPPMRTDIKGSPRCDYHQI